MSIGSIATRLYQIQSNRNISILGASIQMMRENLAIKFSLYNMVRSLTKSDFLATVAQIKFGNLTPQQKREKKAEEEVKTENQRFKRFTIGSINNLSRKIDTLTSITERNTELISTIVSDLGYFKGQRKINVMNSGKTAFNTGIKSTIKSKIEDINAEIAKLKGGERGGEGRGGKGSGGPKTDAIKSFIKDNQKTIAVAAGISAAVAMGYKNLTDEQKRKVASEVAKGLKVTKEYIGDLLKDVDLTKMVLKGAEFLTLGTVERTARRMRGESGIPTSDLDPSDPNYEVKLQATAMAESVSKYFDPAIRAYLLYKIARGTGVIGASSRLLLSGLDFGASKVKSYRKAKAIGSTKAAIKVARNARFNDTLKKWQMDKEAAIKNAESKTRGKGARKTKSSIKLIESQFQRTKPTLKSVTAADQARRRLQRISKIVSVSRVGKVLRKVHSALNFFSKLPGLRILGIANIGFALLQITKMIETQSDYDKGEISSEEYKGSMISGWANIATGLGTSGIGMLAGFMVGGPAGALGGIGLGLLADFGLSYTDTGKQISNFVGEKLFNVFNNLSDKAGTGSKYKKNEKDKTSILQKSNFDMDQYLEKLRKHEGPNYDTMTDFGYVGAYGIGSAMLETYGFLKPGSTKEFGDKGKDAAIYHPSAWIKSSLKDFLSDKDLQDNLAFSANTDNLDKLTRRGAIKKGLDGASIAAALIAAWHGGVGNAAKFLLRGEDTPDFYFKNASVGTSYAWMKQNYSDDLSGTRTSSSSASPNAMSPNAMPSAFNFETATLDLLNKQGSSASSVSTPPTTSTSQQSNSVDPGTVMATAALQSVAAIMPQLNAVSTETVRLRQRMKEDSVFPSSLNSDMERYA